MKKETIKDVENKLAAAEKEYKRLFGLQRKAIDEWIDFEHQLMTEYEQRGEKVYYTADISDSHCTVPFYERFIIKEKLSKEDQIRLENKFNERYNYSTSAVYTKIENLRRRLNRMKDAEKGISPKARHALNNIDTYKARVRQAKAEIEALTEQLNKYQAKVDEYQKLIDSIEKR